MTNQPISEAFTARSRRGGSGRTIGERPMWLLWPSVALVLFVVVIPFLIGVYISFLRLDQYTIRDWVHAPWTGLENYVTGLTGGGALSTRR